MTKSIANARIEAGEWKIGKDGLPENPKAKPDCKMCKGHGIVEDSELSLYSSVLIDCPTCITPPKKDTK